MKRYHVKQNTLCRLVDIINQTETPFYTTKDHTFTKSDVALEPVSWLKDHKQVISEYGFRSGDEQQRAKYILVVPAIHVEVVQ